MKNQTTLKADNYFVAFAKLTGVGVAAIVGLALLQNQPTPPAQVAAPVAAPVATAKAEVKPFCEGAPVGGSTRLAVYANLTTAECQTWQNSQLKENYDGGMSASEVPAPTKAGAPVCTSYFECDEVLGEGWTHKTM